MRVAAAALVGLAVMAGLAGWYAVGALVLGLVVTIGVRNLPVPRPVSTSWSLWLSGGLRAGVHSSSAALFGAVFATYLFDGAASAAGSVLVLVLGVAEVAGVRVNTYYRRWFAGLALAAVAVFLAICLSIPPVERDAPEAARDPSALLLAIACSMVLFAGLHRDDGAKRGYARFAVAAAAALAVVAAAMYQIGPVRFGLAPTTLRDVVTSAEAAPLVALVAGTVVLTTVPSGIDALALARASLSSRAAGWRERARRTLPCAAIAACLAGALGPRGCLLVAAAVVLLEALVSACLAWRAHRGAGAAIVFAAAVVLLVTVPAGYLAIGLVVAAVGVTGLRLLSSRSM